MTDGYAFTTDWFSRFAPLWRKILQQYPPSVMLEIGAYEGRTGCFLIDTVATKRPVEMHCVDTWAGGVEHDRAAMGEVERRFDANLAKAVASAAHPVAFHKHKGLSHEVLVRLLADGRGGSFDLIYVDGSHQAPDVLTDAVLAFQLLRVDGLLIFDDYLWFHEAHGQQDHYNMPKPAIDAFVNLFQRKLAVIGAPLYQLYTRKTAP
ncbi:class I SAM-dependent methyltransferase [Phenylobacterium sp.]|uniref:class I SAM-dependent methyltransferase n=1 Tax=Phenylobacterium sp. TaxID=1871053 RepID=UPI002F92ECC5